MKNFDEIMGVDLDNANQPESFAHSTYKNGKKWTGIGLIAISGGLIAESFGVSFGESIAEAGILVELIGSTMLVASSRHIREETS